MSPANTMAIDDLVIGLDAAYDVLLFFVNEAEEYYQCADDALSAVAKAASYLHALKYGAR
jgi:hypothetical protein